MASSGRQAPVQFPWRAPSRQAPPVVLPAARAAGARAWVEPAWPEEGSSPMAPDATSVAVEERAASRALPSAAVERSTAPSGSVRPAAPPQAHASRGPSVAQPVSPSPPARGAQPRSAIQPAQPSPREPLQEPRHRLEPRLSAPRKPVPRPPERLPPARWFRLAVRPPPQARPSALPMLRREA